MMGKGPDGGCGTDERPCRPISRVPANETRITLPPENVTIDNKKHNSVEVDFFSQARKALCERSPFDASGDEAGAGTASSLPSGLASLLRQSEGRKKHKKSNSGSDKKSSRGSEKSKGRNVWVETEEYFREIALPDIDSLFGLSSLHRSLISTNLFSIPHVGNEKVEVGSEKNDIGNEKNEGGNERIEVGNDRIERAELSVKTENVVNDVGKNAEIGNGIVEEHEDKQENGQFMNIDSVGGQGNGAECFTRQESNVVSAVSNSPLSFEWLLACKSRIILTSERPSKKRKLLGTDAGLEKVLIGSPCDGNLSLCDFCCLGEMDNELNKLIVCSSCKVAVHRKCYGVKGDVDESWLCSWCKKKVNGSDSVQQPCVLCPKKNGALKPVIVENDGSGSEFAHLFCSLWMPEVYIEDIMKMEPIINLEGIKETRRKLVCNICKVKCGACVQCCHGTCRTSFHPTCAREAGHRMEVWGKHGLDTVELRAFCTKYAGSSDGKNACQLGDPLPAGSIDSSVASPDKEPKLIIGQNGDPAFQLETSDTYSDKSGDCELQQTVDLSDSRLKETSECGDVDQGVDVGIFEGSESENANPLDSLNFVRIMKKLIDRGKVDMKDVAREIGVSSSSLISAFGEDSLPPGFQCKIVQWLKNHAYMGTLSKNVKVKLKPTLLSKMENGTAGHCDGVTVSEASIMDSIAVKSVPPHRRTESNIQILRNESVICSSDGISKDNELMMDETQAEQKDSEELENSSKVSMPNTIDQISNKSDRFEESFAAQLPKSESSPDNLSECKESEKNKTMHSVLVEQNNSVNTDCGNPVRADVNPTLPNLRETEISSSSYVHPSVYKKMMEIQRGLHVENQIYEFEGMVGDASRQETSSSAGVCCNHQNRHSFCKLGEINSDQLIKAQKLGVLELSPADEVEGEIIYFQHRLLEGVVARKHFTENLICEVAACLPREIDAARGQKWDAVLENQYLCDQREAKKQSRKERKHKEAQAVLAAANAAVANSSRISSFRKDTFDQFAHQELMPHPKETLSRVVTPRNSFEKQSDFVNSVSDITKEHVRSCDICRRSETILNPLLVCASCKVAVHLDCYCSAKKSTGPWYCELCKELLSSESCGAPVNFWEKPYFVPECGLCGGTTGAFRKSTDGQWVHAFCAEWIFELTFRRGQVNPIEGMDKVLKGIDMCCICRRKHGVCIKCSYGNCQSTFHLPCARSTGFYMNVKTVNGKLLHKAYCEKHSLEQMAKAEAQRHGVEEIKSIKHVRVELERLRLLCERIVRREKIKRDLVLCSHSILACKKDKVARSVLVQSRLFPPDISSESVTTSIKCSADGFKSCSDAIQRSDDVTVDSTVSVKPRIKITMSMENDQKTENSSTSQKTFKQKPPDRLHFAGKQIPQRALSSRNLLDAADRSSRSRTRFETFEKELIMTSDQASMKNQQLPKGYIYVPVDSLPKETEQTNPDTDSGEPSENDR